MEGLSGNCAEGADVVATEEQVGAPDQVEPQQNRVAGQRDVYLARFLKLNPPTFCGTDDKEDPQCFIRDVVKIGRAMKCPSLELTELASFQLKGAARVWIDSLRGGDMLEQPPMPWKEFEEAFLDRFLPQGVRDAKRQEFEDLWHTSEMSVTEYELKYNELAQYAPGLVPNEYEKVKRFVQRLDEPLYIALAAQVGNFKNVSQAADCARVY